MRAYTCCEGESLVIGDNITVTVIEVGEEFVRLRIEAPDDSVDLERGTFEVTVPAATEKRWPR
jgi:carbon storage regulator CsrA